MEAAGIKLNLYFISEIQTVNTLFKINLDNNLMLKNMQSFNFIHLQYFSWLLTKIQGSFTDNLKDCVTSLKDVR